LTKQISKYRSALDKCLKTQFPTKSRSIDVICILGTPPMPIEDEPRNIELLRAESARYITYDTLITESINSYKDYLGKQKEINELISIIERI